MTIASVSAPVLQPPGKGLPKIELWIARLTVGWQARRTTRQQSAALFSSERRQIMELASTGTAARRSERVLIKRLHGMEDSSRFWSVSMTLDHLRIVNDGATVLIDQLARGQTPERVISTADVKPSPLTNEDVVARFDQSCERFEQAVAAIDDLNTSLRWPHPWFGPMNAARWHFFTAFHMSLHRQQIKAILHAQ